MIKKFEQMDWNEDWEEEEPKLKGPFDDQLKYGKDGPEFKCGDRVFYQGPSWSIVKYGDSGTIVDWNERIYNYLICLDINYDFDNKNHGEPVGHGLWCDSTDLKLL